MPLQSTRKSKSWSDVSREVEYLAPAQLKPYRHNARTHSKAQIKQIAASIKRFGFTVPVLADAENCIIAGHGRVAAAIDLNLASVPVLRVSHLTEAEKRAYIIADNRLAEKAGWDREMLAIELGELSELLLDDIEITGFETAEIDLLLGDFGATADPADELPPVVDLPAVSQRGDLWQLGLHRLLCGDARDAGSYLRLMDGERAAQIIADVPYNVRIQGNVAGRKSRHGEFAFASGEMTSEQFIAFLRETLGHAAANSVDGSIHHVFIDWRGVADLIAAGRDTYSALLNICVWVKTNAGQGSLYRSQHEFVAVFKNGEARHVNNVELGKHGRSRSNVWTYPGANTFRAGRAEDLAAHPTVKPVALVADAMRDCSPRGSIVLDNFMGSGTTIMAGEKVGRRVRGIEYEPRYVDVAIRRWQAFTGKDAVLVGSGQTFDDVQHKRRSANPNDRPPIAADDAAAPSLPPTSAPITRKPGGARRQPKG